MDNKKDTMHWYPPRPEDCYSCGLVIEVDTVLPEDFWFPISKDGKGRGLLCANCIVTNLKDKNPGMVAMYAIPMFGDDIDLPTRCRQLEVRALQLERALLKLIDVTKNYPPRRRNYDEKKQWRDAKNDASYALSIFPGAI